MIARFAPYSERVRPKAAIVTHSEFASLSPAISRANNLFFLLLFSFYSIVYSVNHISLPINLFQSEIPLPSLTMRERKSVKLNLQQQQQKHQNGHLSPFKLSKLLDPDASWDKDQLGDVLHWIRQALALVCGLLWGSIPLVGGIWFLLFVVFSSGIIYGYYALVLKIDEEEFGGHGALLQEGLFASVSLFLLAWILVYSLAHF